MRILKGPISIACVLLFAACGGDDDGDGDSSNAPDGGSTADAMAPDAAPPDSVEVRVTASAGGVQQSHDWFAVQIDDGPYEALAGAGGIYTFEATGRFAVAWHCAGTPEQVWSVQATVQETTAFDAPCANVAPSDAYMVSGELVNAGGLNKSIRMGPKGTSANGATDAYTLLNVPEGTHDMVAVTFENGSDTREKVWLRHAVSVNFNQAIDIDFDEGKDLTLHSLELDGADTVASTLLTTLGTSMELGAVDSTYAAVPGDMLEGNDVLLVSGGANDALTASSVATGRFLKAGQNLDLTFPPAFDSAVVSAPSTSPYVRLAFDFEPADAPTLYLFVANHATAAFNGIVSSGWIGDGGDYETPDFSDAAGWSNAWAIPEGQEADWQAAVLSVPTLGFIDALSYLYYQRPRAEWDGQDINVSARAGSLIP